MAGGRVIISFTTGFSKRGVFMAWQGKVYRLFCLIIKNYDANITGISDVMHYVSVGSYKYLSHVARLPTSP